MTSFHHQWPVAGGRKFGAVMCFLFACVTLASAAEAPEPQTPANPSPAQTVPLTYTETSYSVAHTGLWRGTLDSVGKPFAKEPLLGKGPIHRGTIKVFPKASDQLSFIWEVGESRLRLDLNRNGDLTDDPQGIYVFPAHVSGGSSRYAEFKNIAVTFQAEGGPHRGLFDLSLNSYGQQLSGNLSWRSSWQGRTKLGDREYQVGVVEAANSSAELLLRDWDERDKPFSTDAASSATLPLPTKLFVGEQAYDLERKQGTQPALVFTPVTARLGEVELSGKYIHRLILHQSNGKLAAVFDNPGPVLKVPAGDYAEPEVVVRNGEAVAYRERNSYSSVARSKHFTVTEGKRLQLRAGGPLSNAVTVAIRGPSLKMDYQLQGIEGATYKTLSQDYQKPPRVSILKGGKEIHSGKFEFG